LSHGCPVQRKWLRSMYKTRIGGGSMLFRLTYLAELQPSRLPEIEVRSKNRAHRDAFSITAKVFSSIRSPVRFTSRRCFDSTFNAKNLNRTAVGQARA
jgi:hypothetical protein